MTGVVVVAVAVAVTVTGTGTGTVPVTVTFTVTLYRHALRSAQLFNVYSQVAFYLILKGCCAIVEMIPSNILILHSKTLFLSISCS